MKKSQAILLVLAAIAIGLLMIVPFNFICKFSNKCEPIILSFYIPKQKGQENYEIIFEAKDHSQEVDLGVKYHSMIVRSGEDVEVKYIATNLTNHEVKIRPMPYTVPQEGFDYIKFYECLCLKERKIGAHKSILLSVKLRIDPKIDNDEKFRDLKIIRVGYSI